MSERKIKWKKREGGVEIVNAEMKRGEKCERRQMNTTERNEGVSRLRRVRKD